MLNLNPTNIFESNHAETLIKPYETLPENHIEYYKTLTLAENLIEIYLKPSKPALKPALKPC